MTKRGSRLRLARAAVVVCFAAAASAGESLADSPPDTVARCINVRPEARYRGLGYNHVVHVADVCSTPAECDVSTDVNPDVQHVTVPGRDEVEVTTFIGSPARVFAPKVSCKLAR